MWIFLIQDNNEELLIGSFFGFPEVLPIAALVDTTAALAFRWDLSIPVGQRQSSAMKEGPSKAEPQAEAKSQVKD